MPPRPLLAALLVAAASAAASAAVVCDIDAFTPKMLKGPCATLDGCQNYQNDFFKACNNDNLDSKNTLALLEAKNPRTPQEEDQLKAARAVQNRLTIALTVAAGAGLQAKTFVSGGDFAGIPNFRSIQNIPGQDLNDNAVTTMKAFAVIDDQQTGDENGTHGQNDGPSKPVRDEMTPERTVSRGTNQIDPVATRIESTVLNNTKPGTPPDTKMLGVAGDRYLATGNPAAAERVAREIIDASPKSAGGYSLMSRAALSGDRAAEAAEFARKALALDPSDKEARKALAFAESILSKSRLKGPGPKPAFDDPAGGSGIAGAGGPGSSGGPRPGPARAGDQATPGVSTFGLPPQAPLVAPPHLRNAQHKAAIGDDEGALADLTLALDQNPDDDWARLLRSEVSLQMGNPDAALADADRVLARRPDDPRALRAKASALLALGRVEEALATIERAVALEPLSAAGHLIRGQVLEKLGRAADAIAAYREAARLDPALTPVVNAALRRLGAGGGAVAGGAIPRGLMRGGLITVSLALVLIGLVGGAAAKKYRTSRAAAVETEGGWEREAGPGTVIGGQYRITKELGRGGMGVVFAAVDETLKRPVALKQMSTELLNAEDAARFLQEARLVAQLKHPNVAEIHAAVEDGGLFLVFELVEGKSLDRLDTGGSGLDPALVRHLVGDVCAALGAAHERRIIHRDLKPSNVMVDTVGRFKIMDFGIAHQARGDAATRTSASGTPPYMAPEQAMGSVLPASDLYALGVMTYELLSGRRPFLGPDFLGPKMRGEFPPISRLKAGLPPGLDAFFSSALSPDPSRRPASADAFRKAFDACWDASLPRTVAG